MSVKGEKYASKKAMMKHEKTESKKEMVKEYGAKGAAKKKSSMLKKKGK